MIAEDKKSTVRTVQPVMMNRKVTFTVINAPLDLTDEQIQRIGDSIAAEFQRRVEIQEFCRIYCAVNPAPFNFVPPRRKRA